MSTFTDALNKRRKKRSESEPVDLDFNDEPTDLGLAKEVGKAQTKINRQTERDVNAAFFDAANEDNTPNLKPLDTSLPKVEIDEEAAERRLNADLAQAQGQLDAETANSVNKELQAGQEASATPDLGNIAPKEDSTAELAKKLENDEKALDEADESRRQSARDILQGMADLIKDREKEYGDIEKANDRAATWTGLTELAASMANLIGVGQGNAVSQQYHSFSQDWMRKADADIKEHRSKLDDLRNRQRAIRQQYDTLELQMAKERAAATARRLNNAMSIEKLKYQQAYTQLLEARTNTEKQKAQNALNESEAKIRLIQSQIDRNDAQATAATTRANAAAGEAANRNTNRNKTSEARANRDNAQADKARRGSGTGNTANGHTEAEGRWSDHKVED